MLAGLQVALVARDAVLVTHAARVGARIASVERGSDASLAAAVAAASSLSTERLSVQRRSVGDLEAVTVTYRAPTQVPIVGVLVADVTLRETVSMWRE